MEYSYYLKLKDVYEICGIAIFYKNEITDILDKKAKELKIHSLIAEKKDGGVSEYLLINYETNNGIYCNSLAEAVFNYIYALLFTKK